LKLAEGLGIEGPELLRKAAKVPKDKNARINTSLYSENTD
jgi:hypothetical protein